MAHQISQFLAYGAIFVRGYTLNLRGRMLRQPRAFEIHTCSTARLMFQCVLNSKVQIEHTTSLEACNSGSHRVTPIGTNCHMFPAFVQSVPGFTSLYSSSHGQPPNVATVHCSSARKTQPRTKYVGSQAIWLLLPPPLWPQLNPKRCICT